MHLRYHMNESLREFVVSKSSPFLKRTGYTLDAISTALKTG
jgi:hypothetical protein